MAENNNLQMPIEAATDNDTLPTQRHIESFIYNIRDQQVVEKTSNIFHTLLPITG